jgi:hypothetical protein
MALKGDFKTNPGRKWPYPSAKRTQGLRLWLYGNLFAASSVFRLGSAKAWRDNGGEVR